MKKAKQKPLVLFSNDQLSIQINSIRKAIRQNEKIIEQENPGVLKRKLVLAKIYDLKRLLDRLLIEMENRPYENPR